MTASKLHIDSSTHPTVLLLVHHERNRTAIQNGLEEQFHFIDPQDHLPDVHEIDLCLIDWKGLREYRQVISSYKKQVYPVVLPVLLLTPNDNLLDKSTNIWELVDDSLTTPLSMKSLHTKLQLLNRMRQYSLDLKRKSLALEQKNRELKTANDQLHIYEQAFDATQLGISLSDARASDFPLVYVKDQFLNITDYSRNEVLGRNCRFLQGPDTDPETVENIREALQRKESFKTVILNYTRQGIPFWNELSIDPIRNEQGEVTHFVGIQNDISRLIHTQEELAEEKRKYELITQHSSDVIARLNREGTILFVSPASEEILGYSSEYLTGKSAYRYLLPQDIDLHNLNTQEDESTSFSSRTYQVTCADGKQIWAEAHLKPVFSTDSEKLDEVQLSIRDVSERENALHKIEESLEEKSVLLAEVHHRVKNNLAIISSLLELQADEVEEEQFRYLLQQTQSRIYSIASVHEMLYNSDQFTDIDFESYIHQLFNHINRSYDSLQQYVDINLNIELNRMVINKAIPLGLIISELITNSYKHAFQTVEMGQIDIQISSAKQNHCQLQYQDNGPGVSAQAFKQADSLGVSLIKSLAGQLSGHYQISDSSGFNFTIQFPQ
jgi:PAS domain S-box-containing protein